MILRKWVEIDENEQYLFIIENFPTKHVSYSLYTDNDETMLYPDLIPAFHGNFMIIINYYETILTSELLLNPFYGDILMAVDKMFDNIEHFF